MKMDEGAWMKVYVRRKAYEGELRWMKVDEGE